MRIVSDAPALLEVPVSGTEAGADYGGTRSGWIPLEPGEAQRLEFASASSG